jgi:RimJ/RimL family protein N-acetyltransferase
VTGASAQPVWPAAEPIGTARLVLEPLRVDHADEMAVALDDVRLHEFIGGEPATPDELRRRYALQAVGHAPDGSAGWLNWVLRVRATGEAAGTVQATLVREGGSTVADVAWVVGAGHQGRGYATEAATAMADWLRAQGADTLTAHVHPEHAASIAVATRLGMQPTPVVVDGETRWERHYR